jgi:hypothetical protein
LWLYLNFGNFSNHKELKGHERKDHELLPLSSLWLYSNHECIRHEENKDFFAFHSLWLSKLFNMAQTVQRSWWSRNWIWVVPVGCLTPLFICCGGLGLFFAGMFSSLKSSEPYAVALERVREDSRVAADLGHPITEGFLVFGGISKHVEVRNAATIAEETVNLSIPISGPRGSGTIEVTATKSGDKWSYSTMRVIVAGRKEPINLLHGG